MRKIRLVLMLIAGLLVAGCSTQRGEDSEGPPPVRQAADFPFASELANSNDFRIPMRIGLIYLKRKQYSRALDFLLRACACNVTNYYLWYHMGICYQKLGFTNKALEAFQHAQDQNSEYTAAKEALLKLTQSSVFSRLFRRICGLFR